MTQTIANTVNRHLPPRRVMPPNVPAIADDALIAELRRLNEEGTPAPWAWREEEANGDKPNSKVVFALAGFSPHDDPACQLFHHRVLQLRWSDVGTRKKELWNVSPREDDKLLIAAMRNALPALLSTIDSQRARITELEGRAKPTTPDQEKSHDD